MHELDGVKERLKSEPDEQLSLTDPDARSMISQAKGAGLVGYNVHTAASAYASQRAMLIAISVIAVLIAGALGWLITRRLVTSLGAEPADLSDAAQRVAQGDLRSTKTRLSWEST